MGETTNQIEVQIADARAELGANLQELEQKVKSAADWKHHYRNNPMTLVGFAFGAGMLLAAVVSKRSSAPPRKLHADMTNRQKPSLTLAASTAHETMDTIKSALVGVVAARATDWIGQHVPGFNQQFERMSARK